MSSNLVLQIRCLSFVKQRYVRLFFFRQRYVSYIDLAHVLRNLGVQLNDRILNNELLRHLARLQSDPEASIRTNTCVLIGRLGPTLGYNTKQKVLVPAFSKALKDPFVHARVAGLMAFTATSECFSIEDVVNKVIPNVVGATLDKEK